MEQVNEDHAPVHLTSRKRNAVLISEEDFSSWMETVHLLRSPKNARRLLDSINSQSPGPVTTDVHEDREGRRSALACRR
ncbi:type II toxin-antitoxin system Phd/YefM family antitoxin [Streptomyces sp. NPDC002788]